MAMKIIMNSCLPVIYERRICAHATVARNWWFIERMPGVWEGVEGVDSAAEEGGGGDEDLNNNNNNNYTA